MGGFGSKYMNFIDPIGFVHNGGLLHPQAPKVKVPQAAPPSVLEPDTGANSKLTPAQRMNAIYTSPLGDLQDPNSARATLLGGIK